MLSERVQLMTVDEYLAFEEGSEIKHEYIDGEIYPMTGGKLNHSAIAFNTMFSLGTLLRNQDFRIYTSDMRIRVGETRFVYPDLSVVRGTPQTSDQSTSLLNPTLVVEVTSPSSIDYDRVVKREYYSNVPSLQAYLVIDQHRVLVEMYTRAEVGWHLQSFADLESVVSVQALGCDLALGDIYRDIVFGQEAPVDEG